MIGRQSTVSYVSAKTINLESFPSLRAQLKGEKKSKMEFIPRKPSQAISKPVKPSSSSTLLKEPKNTSKTGNEEKKSLKRKMSEDKLAKKKMRMEIEEGELISSDEEDKENLPADHRGLIKNMLGTNGKTYLEIQLPEKVKLADPADPNEMWKKMRALYGGQRSIKKSKAREFFKVSPSGPLLRKRK
ncbi:unnamed protein product [Bursaphelenchus xylophilus]|uniref:(pine wood nematode) hypothetical protein n=1 Tax=Bursaphelenchus xylophilus TaxID=6326 RepID=A0A1I7RIH0_BURXY|nr:unnamed protein product [Bursaphelenchus xylophilus]CAG9080768.1 unnamed protein product [Bursaphelenchus xylophilus]